MMFVRYVMSSLIFMICVSSVFGQDITQDIQRLYTKLPDSTQKSVNTFAERKFSQSNPSYSETVTNLSQLVTVVAKLSTQTQGQVLRYTQKKYDAIMQNNDGKIVHEDIEEGKKVKKGKKRPDPYYPDPF